MRRHGLLATALSALSRRLERRRRASLRATRALPGLHGRVEVLTDDFGVSHIYADDAHDLFFAQGFVTARDRAFQLDLTRLVAGGRLCELVGERRVAWRSLSVHLKGRTTLDLDRFVRTFGLRRAAEASLPLHSAEARDVLTAYAAGVSAAFAEGERGLEHRLARSSPQPWSAVDSLTVVRAMGFELNFAWCVLVMSMMLADAGVPEELARILWPHAPAAGPSGAAARELAGLRAATGLGWGNGPGLGSNAFAVSGTHTATGAALLANDTHLLMHLPSPWHEVHLVGGGLDLHGYALAGVPGISIGRTPYHAWGITAGLVQDLDFFRERVRPGDPGEVLTPAGWQPLEARPEVYRVRGRAPVTEVARTGPHGPLLEGVRSGLEPDERLALCWTGRTPGPDLDALVGLWRAETLEAIEAALGHHTCPTLNVVYAGADGRVAHVLAGRLPRRRKDTPLRPLEGWTGEWDWQGLVPFAENPRTRDPVEGFVVSSNQRPAPLDYPHELGTLFEPPMRRDRIRQRLLALGPKVDFEDLAAIQLDTRSVFGLEAREALFALGGGPNGLDQGHDPVHAAALRQWASWDGDARADSAGAAVGLATATLFGRALVRRLAGEDAAYAFIELGALAVGPTLDALRAPALFAAAGVELLAVARSAFEEAVALCRGRFGDDPASWTWGGLHALVCRHPLGAIFSLGPEPFGGASDTVNRGEPDGLGSLDVRSAAAMRVVFDARDRGNAGTVLPGGQSGRRLSPHYDDQFGLFLAGQLKPAPVSRVRLHVTQQEIWHPGA
jgi:penicillin amidase